MAVVGSWRQTVRGKGLANGYCSTNTLEMCILLLVDAF